MKNILVPVDFTKVSQNALRYAHEAFPNERLIICHVFDGLYSNDRKLIKAGKTKDMIIEEEVHSFGMEVIGKGRDKELWATEVRKGNPIREILRVANEYGVVHIVMGNRDKYNLMEKLIGTIALGVIKETYIPVSLIPVHSRFNNYSDVLVGIDKDVDDDQIELINDWNKDYGAYVRFEHIDKDYNLSDQNREEIIEEVIEEMDGASGYELNLHTGVKPATTIVDRAKAKNVDMIITFPKKGNILQTFFSGSMAKQLMVKSDIPLLFL